MKGTYTTLSQGFQRKIYIGLLSMMLPATFSATAETLNLTVSGTVISSACTLVPADKDLKVDLGTLESRALTVNPSAVKKFTINLENCDISVLKSAKVTIKGTAAPNKATHLALDASSEAAGFALGFKQAANQSKDLAINTASDSIALTDKTSKLDLGVYAQKLDAGTITAGKFTAKATVEIAYL